MQILSEFNKKNFISKTFFNYFSRPLYSRFFMSQNTQLYSYNSTLPLPNVIANYSTVNVFIDFHLDTLVDTQFDKEVFSMTNKEKIKQKTSKNLEEESKLKEKEVRKLVNEDKENSQKKSISFFYVMDTLIKDSVKLFEDRLNKVKNYLKENGDDTEKSNIIEKWISNFDKLKKDNSKKFILKVAGSEEYLYGDYTLGSYNFVKNKVRQHEGIKLILKSLPFYKIQPPFF